MEKQRQIEENIESFKVEEIMKEVSDKDTSQMLPIYDTEGNLLFPKEINYKDLVSKNTVN